MDVVSPIFDTCLKMRENEKLAASIIGGDFEVNETDFPEIRDIVLLDDTFIGRLTTVASTA